MKIYLNPELTARHIELALKYLSRPASVVGEEWPIALGAFDLLRSSIVNYKETTYTFTEFYTEVVDHQYADAFIVELLRLADMSESPRLVRAYNKRVIKYLAALGVVDDVADEARCLAAFCVYWWSSFMKGYVREQTIFRDLTKAGIQFVGHNLSVREERMSPFDLLIEGFKGDIKTSTYFLLVARSYPLSCDFYITRLFNTRLQRWRDVVIMTITMWTEIDGETKPCSLRSPTTSSYGRRLAEDGDVLPDVARVTLFGETLVIVDYTVWKAKIKAKQSRGGEGYASAKRT